MQKLSLCILLLQFSCTIQNIFSAETMTVKENFISGSFVYACSVIGTAGDILSWYQRIGSDHVLLGRTEYLSIQNKMEFTLYKKLQLSDNNTELYCAKQKELPGGGLSIGTQSNKTPIRIKFTESIKPLKKPIVNVTPNTTVMFDINKTMTFVCNGATPADEKKLTWYIQGLETKPIEKQHLNITEYVNTIQLQMDRTYHRKRLFCAQELPYYHLRDDGTFGEIMYKEIARSEMILLQQKGKGDYTGDPEFIEDYSEIKEGHTSNPGHRISLNLLIVLVVVAVVLIVPVTVWFRCRRQRAPPAKENEEEDDTYATAQVTYAVLDLQTSTTDYVSIPARNAETPYTQIIGVYHSKS